MCIRSACVLNVCWLDGMRLLLSYGNEVVIHFLPFSRCAHLIPALAVWFSFIPLFHRHLGLFSIAPAGFLQPNATAIENKRTPSIFIPKPLYVSIYPSPASLSIFDLPSCPHIVLCVLALCAQLPRNRILTWKPGRPDSLAPPRTPLLL